jgi:hypothetical protein
VSILRRTPQYPEGRIRAYAGTQVRLVNQF